MAELSNVKRAGVWAKLMRVISSNSETILITKQEFRDAVNAADTWVNDNSGSFNSALPLPARTFLTAAQKARIISEITLARWGDL
jgi:cobalamin biosynthesis protein CobT